MATNKRKKTTAVVASVAAVALLLGGTFAWTSISQTAKNESTGIVNVGGRLHDDFNGKNKDVYVENFTDPYNGGQPIYARVRLDEYMEVGSEAGKPDERGNFAADRNAVSVVDGARIDDVDSWTPHKPIENCEECYENGVLCKFHEHWKWEMGGSTTFMPTFNKDKDSLEADVNGTYNGTDETDKIYYDDYIEYTTDETDNEKVYSEKDIAYYDNDSDTESNTVEGQYTTNEETHYAKNTVNATVMTMQAWMEAGSQPGDFWVYDTDGWAYWANPIMPGEATGLLLSGIEMFKNPGEKCYYAINVVGQFATVGDWEMFGVDEDDEDYPSADAIDLLTKASQNVPTVTVTNMDEVSLVKRGDTVNFTATTTVNTVSSLADGEYEWVVLNENRNIITTSTVVDNGDGTATLTVGPEELSAGLYVAARSKESGAVGLSALAVQLYKVTVNGQDGATEIYAGETLQFSATVEDKNTGNEETSGVTWTVSGGSSDNTTIDNDGLLTVDESEEGGTELTITATSINGSFTETYTVTVGYKITLETTGTFGLDGLRVDIKESYYSLADISAAINDNEGSTRYNCEVKEDEDGIYIMITHDYEYYEYADHGTRQLTVTAVEGRATANLDFACNSHANTNVSAQVADGTNIIEFDDYEDTLQMLLTNGGAQVDNEYINWNATTNSKSAGTRMDETGVLYLDDNETSPYVRMTYRTQNAWGIVDLRIHYSTTTESEGLYVSIFRPDSETDKDTVKHGENRSSSTIGSGWTYIYRVYDKDGTLIDQPNNVSIWQGDINITNSGGGYDCTNGYVDADGSSLADGFGSYWIWKGRGNTTPVTFWISYTNADGDTGTFEATIW